MIRKSSSKDNRTHGTQGSFKHSFTHFIPYLSVYFLSLKVENEYGHFGYGTDPRDTEYLVFLRDNMVANGFNETLFFTSDTPATTQDLGAIPGGKCCELSAEPYRALPSLAESLLLHSSS